MPERDRHATPATPETVATSVTELLVAIEREPMPDRLLELARKLQAALRARLPEVD